MIMYNAISSVPSGIRLQHLIRDRHSEILERERNNDRFIHLYDIGAYRVAFERSACRLSDIFRRCEITLFRVPGHPEYVVMASVPAGEVDGYFHRGMDFHDGVYRKVLCGKYLATEDYRKWHEVAVNSVL